MGAWQIDPTDTPKWNEQELDSAKASTRLYKEWIRPILSDCKVHHVLPRPDGTRWDGLFYWSAPLSKGVLFVFRPNSPDQSWTIKLKGLERERKYWIWSEDGSVTVGEKTGAWLMDQGVQVDLPSPYMCDIIMLQADSSPSLALPGEFSLEKPSVAADAFSTKATLSWGGSKGARGYSLLVTSKDEQGHDKIEAHERLVRTSVELRLWPDREYQWWVVASNWGGEQLCKEKGTLRTPALKEHPGVIFVSDVPWAKSTAGSGNDARRDSNYYGKPVVVGGKTCAKAVWTHAYEDATPADIVVDVAGKGYATFVADAGLDGASGGGSVQFLVLVDGVEKARSDVMLPGKAHHFSVDVANAKEVTLRVLNGGDGNACDHAAWGMGRFVKPGVADPFK